MSDTTTPRRGLGRGLEALMTNSLAPRTELSDNETYVELDPKQIETNPEQPRKQFDPVALKALAESIRSFGLLHPIVVERHANTYQLIAGERRWRASLLAGMSVIPAIIRPVADSARHSLEMALTENLVRADLNPLEEATAYSRLADTFGLSHEVIGQRVGRSRSSVANTVRLLNLPASVQSAVSEGRLSSGHARALLALPTETEQEELAQTIEVQGMSVRQVEQAVQEHLRGVPTELPKSIEQTHVRTSSADSALCKGLEDSLGLPVQLQRRRKGGRLVLNFSDDEQLHEVYRKLGGRPL